jgi:hypothetical protein
MPPSQSGFPVICVQSGELVMVVVQATQAMETHLDAVAAVHCVFERQPTQVLVGVLHEGVAPVQAVALVEVHCTQVLVVVLQAGLPATPAQSVSARHCTQLLLEVLQTGVPPVQAVALVEVHCTQVLLDVLQAGLPDTPVQFASAVHCTQLPELQTPFVPEQARLVPHLHLPPEHALAVSMLHCVVQLPQ